MQFDDSLHANRLIIEENKKQWESRRIRTSPRQEEQQLVSRKKKQKLNAKKNADGEHYEEELKGGDDDMEVDDSSYVSMKSINRRSMLPKNGKNGEERKGVNKFEKDQEWQ
jgi:hypothetical protein